MLNNATCFKEIFIVCGRTDLRFGIDSLASIVKDHCGSVNASMIIFSIVEMAKTHHQNIYNYLKYLLEQRVNENMEDNQLEKFAPWNETIQENFK